MGQASDTGAVRGRRDIEPPARGLFGERGDDPSAVPHGDELRDLGMSPGEWSRRFTAPERPK